jgi:uncharacterized protein (TIGR02118 family)
MSVEQFQAHWRDVHGPLVTAVPGIRRYIQCNACPEIYDSYPPAFDGVAELYFDDLEALREARNSPQWTQVVADGPNFLAQGGVKSLIATEVPIVDALASPSERAGMVKYMGLLTRLPGLSVEEFSSHWRDIHGPLVRAEFTEMRRYVQSHALPESYDSDTPPAYDGVPEAWFDSLDAFPWRMLRRDPAERETDAARDSASVFEQPIPAILAREAVLLE